MDCQKVFEELPNTDRVKHVASCDPQGKCELHSVCAGSPGAVASSEVVARQVISKTHVSKTPPHRLDESYFRDATDNGGSVSRLLPNWEQAEQDVHARGEKRAEDRRNGMHGFAVDPERKYLGVIHFNVWELRAISVEVISGYFGRVRLYDTKDISDENYKLHAEIMACAIADPNSTLKNKSPKEVKKILTSKLYMLAKQNGIYPSPIMEPSDKAFDDLGIRLNV